MKLYRCKKTYIAHVPIDGRGPLDEPVTILANAVHAFEDDIHRKPNPEYWEPIGEVSGDMFKKAVSLLVDCAEIFQDHFPKSHPRGIRMKVENFLDEAHQVLVDSGQQGAQQEKLSNTPLEE